MSNEEVRNRRVTTTMIVEKCEPMDNHIQTMTLVQSGLTNEEAMQAQSDFKDGVESGIGRLAEGMGMKIPAPFKAT